MRGKRSKQYRKLMHQYGLHFAFREPYQVILDAAIIQDAARFKMRLGSMLESTLHGTIKPMITQCCIRHLYALPNSSEKDAWIEVAKQAERRRCGHHELDEPLSELECIESVVDPKGSGTNKHRYVVASQEREIREKMREKAGVPLVYVSRSVMVLEPMARVSTDVRERGERDKIRSGVAGRRPVGEKRKRDEDGEGDGEEAQDAAPKKKKKVRGPKEPNPLSVMKAKKDKDAGKQHQNGVLPKAPKSRDTGAEDRPTTLDGEDQNITEGARKRKRERKPKDGGTEHVTIASIDAV